ncbi:ComF family protein [Aliikangiella sp. G2MR2-5]|uniref:ComF family protein n=1 Tax=Aliikangiella sp. G2MR2-5 TaxID=2788943 RepID=UPI0018AA1297|nr:ComF family protein [Aliikangiella sp. G2MR2-5]
MTLICEDCCQRLPYLGTSCRVCALPIATDSAICGHCLKDSPYYDRCIAAFHYEPPVNHFIADFKYQGKLQFINLLASKLVSKIKQSAKHEELMPDALIPVPLYPSKLKHRGFNQALEIAKHLGSSLNIKVYSGVAHRVKDTRQQSELDAKTRVSNLKNAFVLQGELPMHCAIIDDVVTTGSTANELARTLKAAGVKGVELWSLARAFEE